MSAISPIERAIAALRAGRPVGIGASNFLSVETGTQAMLDLLDPDGRAPMLISAERAAALGLANERDAARAHGPVELGHSDWLDRDAALRRLTFENARQVLSAAAEFLDAKLPLRGETP